MDEPKRYREIAADLQRRIESGELSPGVKLPSDAALSDEYGASRNTVREAIKLLLTRGVIEKRPNRGAFVLARKDPFSTVVNIDTGFAGFDGAGYASERTSSRMPKVSVPRVEIRVAEADVADALGVPAGSQVVARAQDRFIDNMLWSTQTTYYPMKLVHDGATRLLSVEDIPEGVRTYLAGSPVGIREIGSHDTMQVRAPKPEEAAAFGIPDDGCIAVFETRQIGVDSSRTPLRLTVSIYPADRNQFSMRTGELADGLAGNVG